MTIIVAMWAIVAVLIILVSLKKPDDNAPHGRYCPCRKCELYKDSK